MQQGVFDDLVFDACLEACMPYLRNLLCIESLAIDEVKVLAFEGLCKLPYGLLFLCAVHIYALSAFSLSIWTPLPMVLERVMALT